MIVSRSAYCGFQFIMRPSLEETATSIGGLPARRDDSRTVSFTPATRSTAATISRTLAPRP